MQPTEATEPRTDYTREELLAATHERLADYALALQNAFQIARKIAEKKLQNPPLRSECEL